jgi:hypothetical protein
MNQAASDRSGSESRSSQTLQEARTRGPETYKHGGNSNQPKSTDPISGLRGAAEKA